MLVLISADAIRAAAADQVADVISSAALVVILDMPKYLSDLEFTAYTQQTDAKLGCRDGRRVLARFDVEVVRGGPIPL